MIPISINIERKLYEEYLRSVFKSEDGHIKITCTCELGEFINNKVSYSDFIVKSNENSIILDLPSMPCQLAKNRYVYFNKNDQKRINKQIDWEIKTAYREHMMIGREFGYLQKDLIQSFLLEHNIGAENYDMLKKYDYRRRLKKLESLRIIKDVIGYHSVIK